MRKMLKNTVGKPGKSEKGFTLIEMLVVVGIIVALAAVIVPTVIKFSGSGEEGAQAAEKDAFQTAINIMMADNDLSTVAASPATAAVITTGTDFDGDATDTQFITEYMPLPTKWCYTWTTGAVITRVDCP